jgi:soluble lytic murein transglycosylase-like protein
MVQIDGVADAALAWGGPSLPAAPLRGARLLYDSRVPAKPALAVTRSILRSNPRLNRLEALLFATEAIGDARAEGLDYGFFCAVLLQESAFDPRALSSAGAIGIAQFTIDTADAYGVDPFEWRSAMRGSAALLGAYLRDYDGRYPDPYAATLAAYNAGPGAVSRYHGVPPYRETREYISLVYDRWSRIVRDVTGVVIPRS